MHLTFGNSVALTILFTRMYIQNNLTFALFLVSCFNWNEKYGDHFLTFLDDYGESRSSLSIVFKGTQGQTGLPGPQGFDGPPGIMGPQGEKGFIGETGIIIMN